MGKGFYRRILFLLTFWLELVTIKNRLNNIFSIDTRYITHEFERDDKAPHHRP